MTEYDRQMILAAGLNPKDFEPAVDQTTLPELEAALVEVAEMTAANEVSLEDLTLAVLELAEMLGG